MIKNLHFIVFYFFLNATVVFGQEINVTGTVSDAETGEPIPGVNIRVKGTSSGTATDFQGQYSVSVTASDVLIFSFVGYNTQELTVNNQTSINVSLETDVTQLQEIVVIGYGVQSKDDATGAVTAIGPENFNKGAITSPQELLMGRTSGVQITTNSGAPGSGATIRIRGGSSLSASNDPLIVIDGVPLDNEGISGMRNPLSAINPNDIETFTILKDASATAIYGSRASNGVIIITTKRGQSGKPQFSYSGNLSYNSVASKLDVMTGDEYRAMITERVNDPDITNPPASALDLLGTANTNWQNEVFGTAIGTDHNISMSGSAGNLPYRASIGYTSQK
ncbi:MAG: TonB-dependent receptor plug domain-containing protein, partial [Cyclobacteriaceae bacterium]|nr:TonB-dependent receptor plug domain-containing protein [Cyclobacteriaceae bacterium]